MLTIVAVGLLVSGVTIWPATWELKALVDVVWGPGESTGVMHGFVLRAIEAIEYVGAEYPFLGKKKGSGLFVWCAEGGE